MTQTIKEIVASDLPNSEVITTLTKRVAQSEIHNPDYKYIFSKLFAKELVFDGLKDVNYVELTTTTTDSGYSDTTIEDFNGESNKVIRDTVVANTQSNVKTKILDEVLMNFRTTPADAIKTAFENASNIEKTQDAFWDGEMWKNFDKNKFVIDVTGLGDVTTTGTNVNKMIYNYLTAIGTTSKNHPSIGVNGVITTADGNSIQPSKKYDSNEFIMIKNKEFNTNTVFDGERSFFNWDGSSFQLADVLTLDFEIYETFNKLGFDYRGIKAILIHREAFLNTIDWEASKIANGPKLYHIITNYLKTGTYKRLDKPMVAFTSTTPPKKG